ncbi:MAG: PQQ-binding-like beta-propeller repeat protein [Thermoanaerobaculia bacterium]|nr:PQQ-binding-like beta-propeller repeat protein [Thermoanaerobaculia bacterium]
MKSWRATMAAGGAALLALLAGAGPAQAEDWPQWRGPQRDGVWREDGIVATLPSGTLEPVWRAPVGSGYAGPAVAAGVVYVLDWEKEEGTRTMSGTERLHAFDEATGAPRWTVGWPVGYGSIMASYAIGPRATPTVDGDLVFVLGAVGDLLAIEVDSGKVAWSHDFVDEYDASIPIWGTTSSPLVDGDLVITVAGAEPDGKVIAYDRETGEERWRAVSSQWEMGYEQPIIIDSGGVRQLIVWEPQAVFSLDPATGRELWSHAWNVGQGMTVATPAFDGDRLLFSQFYRGSLLLELAGDRPAAKEVWVGQSSSEMPERTDGLHALITTPILDGDTIYGVCSYGEFRALDAATGKRLWVDDSLTRQGRWGTAFMVRHGDRWFVNNDEGELMILKLRRDGPEVVSRAKLIEPTSSAGFGPRRVFDADVNWSHPAYANRHVVARNDREVIRVSLAK